MAATKLNAAYAMENYDAAKQTLNQLHRELMDLNPSAARSLAEGMEETLTVHRLQIPINFARPWPARMLLNRLLPSWKEFVAT